MLSGCAACYCDEVCRGVFVDRESGGRSIARDLTEKFAVSLTSCF